MKQKTTSKSKQKLSKKNNVTVIFGYTLFLLTILGLVLLFVIPMSSALFYPTSRYFNIIVLMLTFVAAAILPALISYILGDRATHVKNKAAHHYNGVLFGIAAYWVASALSYIGFGQLMDSTKLPVPFPMVVANAVPIVLTVAVMAFVAITYAKKQKNKASVLEHRPYQFVLVGSILALYVGIVMDSNYEVGEALWTSLASLAFPVVLTVVSYGLLAKYHTSRFAGFTDAVIAMSLSYITLVLMFSYAVPYLDASWPAVLVWSYIVALVVWMIYLYLRNRKAA